MSESVTSEPIGDRLHTPEDQLDATIWRVLRVIYLRVDLKALSDPRSPADVPTEEANELLAPWFRNMEADLEMLREVVRQGRLLGVQDVHHRLHGRPGVDHEMLDEAVEFGADRG